MAEWEFRLETDGSITRLSLLRDGKLAGNIRSDIFPERKSMRFEALNIDKGSQREFMKDAGLKIGEALFLRLLNRARHLGIERMTTSPRTPDAKRFISRFSAAGMLAPIGGDALQINWKKVPVSGNEKSAARMLRKFDDALPRKMPKAKAKRPVPRIVHGRFV